MFSLVKINTSSFGNLVDGRDEEDWFEVGVIGEGWRMGVNGGCMGSGSSGVEKRLVDWVCPTVRV